MQEKALCFDGRGIDLVAADNLSGVRLLNEDQNIILRSWIDFDLLERYQLPIKLPHGRMEVFLFVRNLLNTKWEQATSSFASQLRNEAAPAADSIYFVPGNPRTLMGGFAWYF